MANEDLRIWGIHTTDDSLFLHDNVVLLEKYIFPPLLTVLTA